MNEKLGRWPLGKVQTLKGCFTYIDRFYCNKKAQSTPLKWLQMQIGSSKIAFLLQRKLQICVNVPLSRSAKVLKKTARDSFVRA
ncbi:hypothetical protein KSC_108950 [Ktedonobacter sp. SOSP1-52]|nr:hypothetical protein KSC_108950 [Ktedonobacter sp. SOSP1-52]